VSIGEYSNKSGLDSVTTVLGVYVDKSWFTSESCYRGSFVHNALKNYCLGIWSPEPPEEYKGYIESGISWLFENVQDILSVESGDETRMVDTVHKYSGQPDLICTLKINPEPGIVDWKTSLAFSVVWNGQIAGYWNLARINGFPDVVWGASVRLRKDGRIALSNFIQNLDLELQYFLNANAAYRRYKEKIT
jgi:hypothetical protein